jgi:hypothetical protein
MKFLSKFSFFSNICFVIFSICAISTSWGQTIGEYQNSAAQGTNYETTANTEVQKKLKTIHKAKSVVLMFVTPNMTEGPSTEMEFRERARKYLLNDSEKISKLEALLINSNTVAVLHPQSRPGPLVGVYLRFSNRKEMAILFNESESEEVEAEGRIKDSAFNQVVKSNISVIRGLHFLVQEK